MTDLLDSSTEIDTYPEEVSYPSDELPSSPSSNSSNSVVTFYKPPTILSLLRTTAINLILPFINGVMLGFGEIFAHELAFRWGWRGAKVRYLYTFVFERIANLSRYFRNVEQLVRVWKFDRRD
jgi:hypothetical protein